ncbi:Lrp/AsnC family transcriptional regulator [Gordonia rubripertincta]|uniref:Lrp/AsnC family transcriptional regulator n=1 Tax=Gordonia rubripertincta TaxID=36822 RepID=UPI0013C3091D|nr:Lrp/AsnC family transcriptional regulator [Gordonia rubripertincta]
MHIAPPSLTDRLQARTQTGSSVGVGTYGAIPSPPDSVDELLIRLLLDDSRVSNREMAQAAGISESAVSTRLKRLMAAGRLVFTALIDWETAGFEWFVIARFRTGELPPAEVAAVIGQLPNCEATAVVLGAYDVVAYFLVHDRSELHDLVNVRLSAIPGVANVAIDLSTETAVTVRGRQFFMARNVPPIRLPAPRIDIDDLDISIMQALVSDSRQSSRSIARALGVAEGTIRARMTRLDNAGLCRVVVMAEPISLGMAGVVANIALTVDRSKLDHIRDSLLALDATVFFAVTVGTSDVVLTITAADHRDLLEIVTHQIRSIPGVWTTDTLPMMEVIRFSPYLKRLS